MLVVKDKKKLLLNLREPDQVMALIPGAAMRVMKGQNIVSVPHDQDTVRVLRNLGFKAPGPIRSYYDWPGRWTPFTHQFETAEFLSLNQRAFCLNGMGSGKTAATLWAFDWLRKTGMVRRALIISPLSTLERTWADEIFKNHPDMTYAVIHGNPAKKQRLLAENYDTYVINHDGIKDLRVMKVLMEREDIDLVVVDELASFRNSSTARWKVLNTLLNGDKKTGNKPKPWVWGLTGTPIPNEPTDAWGQCKLIRPESVPKHFGGFRDTVMKQLTQYKWAARDNSLQTVYGVMQPAIRFAREDCIDLPPTTYIDREVELTQEQTALYKDMMSKYKAEYEGGQIMAMNEAVRIGKLLQIVCGVAYTDDGDIAIPSQARVDEVRTIVEEAGAKVIVFVPLTGALNGLAKELAKEYSVEIVHGQTSKAQRDRIFSEFMAPNGPRVLVAQPGTMAHGLSLTSANTIIWYAPIHSSEIYEQANARIVRPGQKKNTLIVRIGGSDLEKKMYAKLEKRGTTQGVLLDMFK